MQISFQDVNISEELQALIAPAILPRSMLNFEVSRRTHRAAVDIIIVVIDELPLPSLLEKKDPNMMKHYILKLLSRIVSFYAMDHDCLNIGTFTVLHYLPEVFVNFKISHLVP